MNTKHTPGPWTVSANKTSVHVVAGSFCVATTANGCTGNVPPAEDNARLIAAAPELLAALRPVADLYEYEQTRGQFPRGQTWDTIPHNIGQAARAAIAKVEGQS